ncbi:DNA polymerase III, subunit gamma and tau, partial [Candidatus Beckwithbacteria bacterium CG10_big_fil_rev_8_21_14_0_10_34_10]
SSSKIPHAFLFSGPKGLGKTSAGRIMAKSLNCLGKTKKEFEPCNKCSLCQSISQGTCLDLIEIDAASNRGIDDIRGLKERIKLIPAKALKKVYVIDEVHMLTKEAFNALLKTLEEPPEHAFFILCTTEPEKLPDTIISRCQQINFQKALGEEIIRSLKRVCQGEKIKISEDGLDLIARHSGGSFRDGVKILQELSLESKNISFKKIADFLEKETFLANDFLILLSQKDTKKALLELQKAVNQGLDLKAITQNILELLRQAIFFKYNILEKVTDFNLTIEEIKILVDLFDQAGRQLKGAVIPELPLELAILEWGSLKEDKIISKITSKKPIGKETVKKASLANKEDSVSDFSLESKWRRVLDEIKKENKGIEALLKSTKLKGIRGKKLEIEVFYKFHRDKLNEPRTVNLVQKKVKEAFSLPLKIEYV